MEKIRRNFREWWQIPRKVTEEQERKVSFLELFYDLVYVVLIAQLAHALAEDVTLTGIGNFIFLFIIVWWSWSNGTTYHDIHGRNDIRTRVFTFLQMFAVILMAIFAHDAIGKTSAEFALSYALFQLILTFLWWRTGVHDPDHAPLSTPYSFAFLVNTIIFAASAFVPEPERYYMWAISIVISLLLPAVMFNYGMKNKKTRHQMEVLIDANDSLVERFGLFTIIVLGEVVVGVVSGASHHPDLDLLITAILGTSIAVSLWWIYFDLISNRKPHKNLFMFTSWFYLHLPMTMGIVAIGAATLNIIEHSNEHISSEVNWLLILSIVITLICIKLLTKTIKESEEYKKITCTASKIIFVSMILVLILGFFNLAPNLLLGFSALLILLPIIFGFLAWLKTDPVKNNK